MPSLPSARNVANQNHSVDSGGVQVLRLPTRRGCPAFGMLGMLHRHTTRSMAEVRKHRDYLLAMRLTKPAACSECCEPKPLGRWRMCQSIASTHSPWLPGLWNARNVANPTPRGFRGGIVVIRQSITVLLTDRIQLVMWCCEP